MMQMKSLAERVSREELLSFDETVYLLSSKKEVYKTFGLNAVFQSPDIRYLPYVKKLAFDNNQIVASNAIEGLFEL